MTLRDALELTEGTELIARGDTLAPVHLTMGERYFMVGDAKPVFESGIIESILKPFLVYEGVKGETPCNAVLPIIDDKGRKVNANYTLFVQTAQLA